MKKIFKISLCLIITFVLAVSAPVAAISVSPVDAYAASVPKPTVSKVIVYVGYKTYQIEFSNLNKNASVSFKSSNTKVARVSDNGIITPISEGNSSISIKARQNGRTYNSKIKVTVKIPFIEIKSKTNSLNIGDEFTFKATAYGTAGKVTWSVSDSSIAKIDKNNGKLTALSAGEVDVIAKAGNISSRYTVEVNKSKFSVESSSIEIYDQQIVYVNIDNLASNENFECQIGDSKIVSCKWGELSGKVMPLLITPKYTGSTTITITSNKVSDRLEIKVTVVSKPSKRSSDAKSLTAQDIYNKCLPSTVELNITKSEGKSTSSGFFIQSGVIVTNYHVIRGATKIEVVTNSGKTYNVTKIDGYDETYDLAILEIDAVTEHLQTNLGDIVSGETVYALGNPLGLTNTFTHGIVSNASRVLDGTDYIQVTAPTSQGDSGGPLINEFGEVIGVITFIVQDGQNLNFAVNVSQVSKVNTNTPVSADDFYKKNDEPYVLKEDSSKSADIDTAQDIQSNYFVDGSLYGSNTYDLYHFNLTGKAKVTIVFMPDKASDLDYLNFAVINSNYDIEAYSEVYTDDQDGTKYRAITTTFDAGDHYVFACDTKEDFVSLTRGYQFYILISYQ